MLIGDCGFFSRLASVRYDNRREERVVREMNDHARKDGSGARANQRQNQTQKNESRDRNPSACVLYEVNSCEKHRHAHNGQSNSDTAAERREEYTSVDHLLYDRRAKRRQQRHGYPHLLRRTQKLGKRRVLILGQESNRDLTEGDKRNDYTSRKQNPKHR